MIAVVIGMCTAIRDGLLNGGRVLRLTRRRIGISIFMRSTRRLQRGSLVVMH